MENKIKTGFGILAFLLYGCMSGQPFTSQEREIITSGKGIMRLLTIEDREDSLFLRANTIPLGEKELTSEEYLMLKQRMLSTVNDSTNPGVGIAAPQVGIARRLIAVQRFDKEGEPFEFYANPRIVYCSEEKSCGPEGCLSVPEVRDSVWRSTEIVVVYWDEEANEKRQDTVKGFTAVIFQHETDHLNGVLFIDRSVQKLSL